MPNKTVFVRDEPRRSPVGYIFVAIIVALAVFFGCTWYQRKRAQDFVDALGEAGKSLRKQMTARSEKDAERAAEFERASAKAAISSVAKPKAPKRPVDAWDTSAKKDEITDVVRRIAYLKGLRVGSGIGSFIPGLAIVVNGKRRMQDAEVWVGTGYEVVARDCKPIVRVDAQEPETVELVRGTSGTSICLPDGFAARLDGAQTLVVRLETFTGKTLTLKFTLDGVRLNDIANKLNATRE